MGKPRASTRIRNDLARVIEMFDVADLKRHPRNYRGHPEDQVEHICENIRANGIYRNILLAKDLTILGGHGVVQACEKLKIRKVPGIRLPVTAKSPKALKILAADNEISRLADDDSRLLSELLKDVQITEGLLGSGYDEKMLANLVFVTRPSSEIRDFDEAAEWVGMPEFDLGDKIFKLVISFRSETDRENFMQDQMDGAEVHHKAQGGQSALSVWWPAHEREDLASLRFEG